MGRGGRCSRRRPSSPKPTGKRDAPERGCECASAMDKKLKEKKDMKRIVVLGAGESGAGAAVLAKKEGFDVFVSDTSRIKDKYKKLLDDHEIEWEEGHHTEEKILNADEVVKSPGIPKEAPMVQKLMGQGTHIISEIEFAGRYTDSKMICITGSNGKTTTTSLIYHIFKSAGYDVGLAGNIGASLALQVAEQPHAYYVIELSSFQLDNMYDFRANIAILLNITPDHLDRYDNKFENYADAKMRITQNQTPEDSFIYWNDDPVIRKELEKFEIKAVRCPFSELKEKGSIGYIEEGQYKLEYPTPFNMEQEELSLTGKHNIYNSLAAGLASNISGIKKEIIRKSLSDFPGVEHRQEKVCTVGGVLYVNDSKATNVDACWYALEGMKTPVVLILGGKDKGNDYTEIKELGQNHTVIFSSHILSEVQTICDQILIIARGKLLAFGTPESLEQQLLESNEITITAEAGEEEVREILAGVNRITGIRVEKKENGLLEAHLQTDHKNIYEVSGAVFSAFAAKGKVLLEMAVKKANLEDIFIELTEQKEEAEISAKPGKTSEKEEAEQ